MQPCCDVEEELGPFVLLRGVLQRTFGPAPDCHVHSQLSHARWPDAVRVDGLMDFGWDATAISGSLDRGVDDGVFELWCLQLLSQDP